MNGNELGEARELELALVIADLSEYTAFTETHGALYASEIVRTGFIAAGSWSASASSSAARST